MHLELGLSEKNPSRKFAFYVPSTGDGQSKPVISDTFRTSGYKSNHFDGPARHSLYGTMAVMHENEAPPAVPATIDDLVCAFDSAYPTLDGQLGPKVRMRKQKTKGNPRTREVPNFNGWLNVHTLVQAGNETLERNGIKMEKIEIAETAAAGAAVSSHSSHAGSCVQQCSCTVHVTEADVLAAAEEIKKRQQQGTRSTASIVLDAKTLTDDRSRSIAAGSKYVRLKPSTTSRGAPVGAGVGGFRRVDRSSTCARHGTSGAGFCVPI